MGNAPGLTAIVFASVLLVHGASAQGLTFTKKPLNSTDGLHDALSLLAHNGSDVPVAITRISLTKCVNIRAKCDTVIADLPAIMPGQERTVLIVPPLVPFQPMDFSFAVDWRQASECQLASSETGPGTVKPHPPQMRTMIMPPTGGPKGAQVEVSFFVAATGSIDSIAFAGLNGANFAKKLRANLMGYKFVPGNDSRGCPAPGVTGVTLTFG